MDGVQVLQWVLRISMAGTYIGHGAFGIIGKEAWLPYFNLFGFSDSQAWVLQPAVGTMDIALGILILVWPTRLSMLHLACWGVFTAMLRPLTGEGVWEEVFERSGNYCVPMALLVLSGGGGDSITCWLRRVSEPPVMTRAKAMAMHWILRVGTALLLVGHGGFGVWMHKNVWLSYFGELGVSPETVSDLNLFYVVGWFEIAFGIVVLLKPLRPVLIAACAYKIGTELLRPAAGEPWWEFIERSGSYLAPVSLLMVDRWRRGSPKPDAPVHEPIAGGRPRTKLPSGLNGCPRDRRRLTFAAHMSIGDSWRIGVDENERIELVTEERSTLSATPSSAPHALDRSRARADGSQT